MMKSLIICTLWLFIKANLMMDIVSPGTNKIPAVEENTKGPVKFYKIIFS